jgi:pyridoxal phosphate enzyme (YggS family)
MSELMLEDIMPPDIADNIAKVRQRIRSAWLKSGRSDDEPILLAVSKGQAAAAIRNAVAAGVSDIGENYWQEAEPKLVELAGLPITWHFIGPLQANKTRAVATHFHWVHSVDRAKVAERLAAQRPPHLPPLNICLQVNINHEHTKSGVEPAGLEELAAVVAALPQLRLRGLMAIPQATDDPAGQRHNARLLRVHFERLRQRWPQLDTLSIGMSSDLEAAVAEGSTLLRVGTDIFGRRPVHPPVRTTDLQ